MGGGSGCRNLGRSAEGWRDSAPRVVACRHRHYGWRGCTGAAPVPGPHEASRCSLVRAPRTPDLCLWPLENSIQPQPLCPDSPSEDRLPSFICGKGPACSGVRCSQGRRWEGQGWRSPQASWLGSPLPPPAPLYQPAAPGARATPQPHLLEAGPCWGLPHPAPCSPCSAQAKLLFLEVCRRGSESLISTYIQPGMTS